MKLALNVFGFLAFISTFVGLVPQIYKSYQSKSTKDVSMLFLMNYLLGSICWMIYASLDFNIYVLASNILGALSCIYLIYLKMRYDEKK